MSIYDIHFCRFEELDDLCSFIDKYWKKGHVLTYSKDLFEFQHLVDGKEYYDFVIARNLETSEIDGVYGFIESQKYDKSRIIPNIAWGAIWKVRDDVHNKEIGKLGLKLLKYIIKNSDTESFAAIGISDINKQIVSCLNFQVDELSHYYIVNEYTNRHIVALNPIIGTTSKARPIKVSLIDNINSIIVENHINPYKNIDYFKTRYQQHPIFDYKFLLFIDNERICAVAAVRIIDVKDVKIMRIIDMIGTIDSTISIYDSMQQILQKNNLEYVDCLNYGIDEEIFMSLGFQKAPCNDDTVIPEHLDPLEHKYVSLEFEYMGEKPIIVFKGDGDQDRPNRV